MHRRVWRIGRLTSISHDYSRWMGAALTRGKGPAEQQFLRVHIWVTRRSLYWPLQRALSFSAFFRCLGDLFVSPMCTTFLNVSLEGDVLPSLLRV